MPDVLFKGLFCYHASGVNAFNFSWEVKNHWIVPPPNLLVKTINKILHDNATCTLIVPKWESAPFWPILIDIESNKTCIKSKFIFSCKLIKKGNILEPYLARVVQILRCWQ